ncbi:hypothetical protein FW754_15290 [Acinetobacter sp. 1207_04]|uniref:hypothetical protein n=1 Tax=Acinetobacter sp. 1207_04 TaxID=2604449 RepID=UPI0040584CD4
MASKPKVVQQESPEEIERKATELAQKETNETNAAKRKNKQSTALSSLDMTSTALGTAVQKTNTGT